MERSEFDADDVRVPESNGAHDQHVLSWSCVCSRWMVGQESCSVQIWDYLNGDLESKVWFKHHLCLSPRGGWMETHITHASIVLS